MSHGGRATLFDASRCIACRSCQVACKQWNGLGAESPTPENRGGYEHPHDLSATQWLLIHFREGERADGSLFWHFCRSSCRHCVDAPCRQKARDKRAVVVDEETGAVLFTEHSRDEDFAAILRACPYHIPRRGPGGALFKCTMCVDRLHRGEQPACDKACPTGANVHGPRDEILALARERLSALRLRYPNAAALDLHETRLILLLADRESRYKTGVER